MKSDHAAVLGQEMDRCMRELDVLRTEGLEAELLGPRYRRKPDAWRPPEIPKGKPGVPPPEIKVTSGRRGRGGELDSDDEDWGGKRRNSSRGSSPAVDDDERSSPEDEEYSGPRTEQGVWGAVSEYFGVDNIQSEAQMRELILQAVSNGVFAGKMTPKVRDIFYGLTDTVLKEALPYVKVLAKEADKRNMMEYGLAMVIVKEYMKLSGLREHVRQDMRSFVSLYDITNKRPSSSSNDPVRYLKFDEFVEDIMNPASDNHIMGTKMTLRAIAIDIKRKMLLASTHLIELIAALGKIQQRGK